MNKLWTILYFILCCGWGVFLHHLNLGPADWEFWVALLGVAMAYICGSYTKY